MLLVFYQLIYNIKNADNITDNSTEGMSPLPLNKKTNYTEEKGYG